MTTEDRGVVTSPSIIASTHAGDAVTLVDQVLDTLSAIIHDRPVQQVVAAKLLLETGIAEDERTAMVQRGLDAIGTAGTLSRDIMWALARPHVRMERVETDLSEMVARAGPGDARLSTSVALAASADPALVRVAFEVVHNVLADVVLSGRHGHRVCVRSDAEAVRVEVELDATPGDPGSRVWLRLAAARAESVGGQLRVLDLPESAGRRLVEATLPERDG